jgi:UDP-N-acetylglucosamine--N-acetylmuramyl-(pentapeptide) pyrophosphoryl-undecaprenol N-acetylglucosamine transferase
MAGELGFYVHHHGSGHATRTLAIANHLPGIIRVFTSAPERFAHANPDKIRVVALPPDVVPEPDPPPGILHYAPLGVAGIRQRMQLLADWFATEPGKLLVVDISVEIALFARLCSVPVVLVRQHGIRTDPPHLAAYESCQSVLAPFPAEMEEPATPEWVRQKTCYAGGFSRYAGRKLTRTEARRQAGMELLGRYVLVISGQGGAGIPIGTVIAAARACPDWRWIVAGPVAAPENLPDNVDLRGMVPDTFPYLT